jgi:hypothetical protein
VSSSCIPERPSVPVGRFAGRLPRHQSSGERPARRSAPVDASSASPAPACSGGILGYAPATAGIGEVRQETDRCARARTAGRHGRCGYLRRVLETSGSGAANDGRGESPLQRADRNMVELLQELRVAQTGVQILFAFLLALLFTQRFASINDFQRWTYVITLLLSAATAGLLVAPAAVHRVTFRRGLKAETVQLGHRLFGLGLATLVLTLVGCVLLVLDIAVGRSFAVLVAAVLGVVLLGLWFALPLPVLRRAGGRPGQRSGSASR